MAEQGAFRLEGFLITDGVFGVTSAPAEATSPTTTSEPARYRSSPLSALPAPPNCGVTVDAVITHPAGR